MHVHHGISRNDAIHHRFTDTRKTRIDKLLGNVAADNLVFGGQSLATLIWRDSKNHMTILALATTLLLEQTFSTCAGRDRFTIGDLRLTGIRIHLEFALHAILQNLQMQLAHS